MAERVGRFTVKMSKKPSIIGFAASGGKKEKSGPIGDLLDKSFDDDLLGQDSWEQAESALLCNSISLALKKAELKNDQADVIFAGDLLDQSMSSTFGLKQFRIPTVGLFGACSTMALSLSQAALAVDSGWANVAVAATSSHFCSAERQFRFPLEYGGRRTPNSQWTVTGSGATVVGFESRESAPKIDSVCIGRIADLGVTDANNMGAAMAPAAADTIKNFLTDTGTTPDDYDLILTGDLGEIGSRLLQDLLERDGIMLKNNYDDCGLLIFDKDSEVGAGGSGCGCSATVLCAKILPEICKGKLGRVLFVATGALMSPKSAQQGLSIPAVAHAVLITS